MKPSTLPDTGPAVRWFPLEAVALPTGLKSWPTVWALAGDAVKVQGQRGTWRIVSMERRVGSDEINVEVIKGHSRVFRSTQLTALKCLAENDWIRRGDR